MHAREDDDELYLERDESISRRKEESLPCYSAVVSLVTVVLLGM